MFPQNRNKMVELDGLERLAGETRADKAALWARLESKLNAKPQKTNTLWYLVAACLVVCIVVPIIMSTKKTSVDEVQQFSTVKTLPPMVTNSITDKKLHEPIQAQPLILIEKQKFLENKNKIEIEAQRDTTTTVANLPTIQTAITDSFSQIMEVEKPITVVAKKPLLVVHNNELLEEDRIIEQNTNLAKSLRKRRTKVADKLEYAGSINFRIYLNN